MKMLLLLFFFLSFKVTAGVSIIADLDDTIKIINSGNYLTISFNALFKNHVFAGMPEFLEGTDEYADKLHILSGSPRFIRRSVVRTFSMYGIEHDHLVLKEFRRLFESKYSFKLRKLKKIISTSDDQFILLGDDVSHDPAVYEAIRKLYPDKVLASYIHHIRGKSLPPGQIGHWISFEIAVHEYAAGRMSYPAVIQVARSLLRTRNMARVFPGFAICPPELPEWEWLAQTPFALEALEIEVKLEAYCQNSK